ncbi:SDR family NAD(P)-dependent oxidoreductase [Nonomuraea sp. NPDC052129]|uniref:SDR family NAD(P)-dependent oxidoreductase n=1 Tax=Nonomuraea sp. NPDC052129 TaxID=3154651 RepID=UPI0034337C09
MSGRFAGRTAVVTGGASGIGAATAARLTAEGASVLVVDVVAEPPRTCAGYLRGDVAEEETWDRVAEWGPIDVIVSNAAAAEVAPAHLTRAGRTVSRPPCSTGSARPRRWPR